MKEVQVVNGCKVAIVHRRFGLIYVLGHAWCLWYECDLQRAYQYF